MSLGVKQEDAPSIAADIDWEMLDKSKFFVLGAALFSGVSSALYPFIVLKTRQQISHSQISSFKTAFSILRFEGLRGFYRGLGTSLMGTIPARALYMTALEVTKSKITTLNVKLGMSESTASAVANATGGLSAALAAQMVWTPVDVVSQRLMVQGLEKSNGVNSYSNGVDAFRKIVCTDGARGLYRGFGVSILTYAPSNAVWWATYSTAYRIMHCNTGRRDSKAAAVAVQGLSAAAASGVSAVITMPIDTIKTRLQVLEGKGNGGRPLTVRETVSGLVREGGLRACYRGLIPRWASMSMSATTMVTTYEFLKRLSAKQQEKLY